MCKTSSLSTCLMMSYGASRRCLTIVMQRMFCQRSTLRVGSSCYIPAVMGHPKNANGCHCVLSLCHLMYCHLPNISLWRLRKFTKPHPTYSKYHLLSCHSSVHMTHSKSSSNLSPRLFFHSLCITSSLHSTPYQPHRPFPGPLAQAVHSIHSGARGEELLHSGGVAVASRPVQRCPTSGAEGLGDVNGWRSPPCGSPPPNPRCSGCNLWSEVREFHLFQFD